MDRFVSNFEASVDEYFINEIAIEGISKLNQKIRDELDWWRQKERWFFSDEEEEQIRKQILDLIKPDLIECISKM